MSKTKKFNKLIAVFSIVAFSVVVIASLNACKAPEKLDGWQKVRVADSALYADNYEYVDYAKDVVIDYEEHPYLKDQGLFWCYFDKDQEVVLKLRADTEEGAALVSSDKPTIINVHGMMSDGHYTEEKYWTNGSIGSAEELGVDDYPIQMTKLWLDAGYNVGIYNYNRFASESIDFSGIEEKIWAINGANGIRYRIPNGKTVDDVIPYTISELFAADYLRAIALLPDDFGKEEIRVAAHSMGGEMSAAALFLLTELADAHVKQIDHSKIPSRYMMEDTFFAVHVENNGEYFYGGQEGLICRWSGKGIPFDDTGKTTIEALKDLAANGIVMDYYSYTGSFLCGVIAPEMRKDLVSMCAYVMMEPKYNSYNRGYKLLSEGHNAVRQFLLCSITNPYDPTVTEPTEMIKYAAALPTSEMAKLKGKCFFLSSGSDTVTTADDVYIENTSEVIK